MPTNYPERDLTRTHHSTLCLQTPGEVFRPVMQIAWIAGGRRSGHRTEVRMLRTNASSLYSVPLDETIELLQAPPLLPGIRREKRALEIGGCQGQADREDGTLVAHHPLPQPHSGMMYCSLGLTGMVLGVGKDTHPCLPLCSRQSDTVPVIRRLAC